MYLKIVLIVYIAYLVLMSFVTFILFGKDKKMAQNNGNEVRIKEKTLLSSCVWGGALGGFLGRLTFHHKTKKIYFSITIYFSLILQALILIFMILSVLGII